MAVPRKIPVPFELSFPHGAYAVGEVTPVRDYQQSTKDRVVQAVDPDTGLLVWSVDVVDGDPEARKATRTISVKVLARVQPVLPEALPDLPFTRVELTGLTVTPWVEYTGGKDNDDRDRARVAYSMRATGIEAPSRPIRAVGDGKPVAEKAS